MLPYILKTEDIPALSADPDVYKRQVVGLLATRRAFEHQYLAVVMTDSLGNEPEGETAKQMCIRDRSYPNRRHSS